jgi:hypothetical protein
VHCNNHGIERFKNPEDILKIAKEDHGPFETPETPPQSRHRPGKIRRIVLQEFMMDRQEDPGQSVHIYRLSESGRGNSRGIGHPGHGGKQVAIVTGKVFEVPENLRHNLAKIRPVRLQQFEPAHKKIE